jgi:hypothetical protein
MNTYCGEYAESLALKHLVCVITTLPLYFKVLSNVPVSLECHFDAADLLWKYGKLNVL